MFLFSFVYSIKYFRSNIIHNEVIPIIIHLFGNVSLRGRSQLQNSLQKCALF